MAAEETVRITLSRFEELTMLHNTNKIQEAKIMELLKENRELKELLKKTSIYKNE